MISFGRVCSTSRFSAPTLRLLFRALHSLSTSSTSAASSTASRLFCSAADANFNVRLGGAAARAVLLQLDCSSLLLTCLSAPALSCYDLSTSISQTSTSQTSISQTSIFACFSLCLLRSLPALVSSFFQDVLDLSVFYDFFNVAATPLISAVSWLQKTLTLR